MMKTTRNNLLRPLALAAACAVAAALASFDDSDDVDDAHAKVLLLQRTVEVRTSGELDLNMDMHEHLRAVASRRSATDPPVAEGCWLRTPTGCPAHDFCCPTDWMEDFAESKEDCDSRKVMYDSWCSADDTETAWVTKPDPTEPGCHIRFPSGCPAHSSEGKDWKPNVADSEAACTAEKEAYDDWCWSSDTLTIFIVPCEDSDCSGHGTTTDTSRNDGCDCDCESGWSGRACDLLPPSCADSEPAVEGAQPYECTAPLLLKSPVPSSGCESGSMGFWSCSDELCCDPPRPSCEDADPGLDGQQTYRCPEHMVSKDPPPTADCPVDGCAILACCDYAPPSCADNDPAQPGSQAYECPGHMQSATPLSTDACATESAGVCTDIQCCEYLPPSCADADPQTPGSQPFSCSAPMLVRDPLPSTACKGECTDGACCEYPPPTCADNDPQTLDGQPYQCPEHMHARLPLSETPCEEDGCTDVGCCDYSPASCADNDPVAPGSQPFACPEPMFAASPMPPEPCESGLCTATRCCLYPDATCADDDPTTPGEQPYSCPDGSAAKSPPPSEACPGGCTAELCCDGSDAGAEEQPDPEEPEEPEEPATEPKVAEEPEVAKGSGDAAPGVEKQPEPEETAGEEPEEPEEPAEPEDPGVEEQPEPEEPEEAAPTSSTTTTTTGNILEVPADPDAPPAGSSINANAQPMETSFKFKFEGIKYDMLSEKMKRDTKISMQNVVANKAAVAFSQVVVTLSSGSVVVDSKIYSGPGIAQPSVDSLQHISPDTLVEAVMNVPGIETAVESTAAVGIRIPTESVAVAMAREDFMMMAKGQFCPEEYVVRNAAECFLAGKVLGISSLTSFRGKNGFPSCYVQPSGNSQRLIYNTGSDSEPVEVATESKPWMASYGYRAVCLRSYVSLMPMRHCPEGFDVTSAEECEAAAAAWGVTFGGSFSGEGGQPYCQYRMRPKQVWYNTASRFARVPRACCDDVIKPVCKRVCVSREGVQISNACQDGMAVTPPKWYRQPSEWPTHLCDDDTCRTRCLEDGTSFYSDAGDDFGELSENSRNMACAGNFF